MPDRANADTLPFHKMHEEAVIPHSTTYSTSPAHPFRGLLIMQYFGAFNDNAWKLIVALLGIHQALRWKRWRIE